MWEPRPLTTVRACRACYKESFTFFTFLPNQITLLWAYKAKIVAFKMKSGRVQADRINMKIRIEVRKNNGLCLREISLLPLLPSLFATYSVERNERYVK
jgi:hypothetical protein